MQQLLCSSYNADVLYQKLSWVETHLQSVKWFIRQKLPTTNKSAGVWGLKNVHSLDFPTRSEDYGSTFVNINNRLESSNSVVLSPRFFVSDFNPNLVQ